MDFSSIKSALGTASSNGLLNTGLSLLGRNDAKKAAVEDRKFNAWQAQLNRDFQKQERLDTQEYNVAFWNLNNQYNERMLAEQREYDSPQAQIQRALQAGINPNTIVGGIDGNSANYSAASPISSSPMSGNAASYSSGLPSALTQLWQNIAMNDAQIKLANAQANKVQGEADFDKASFQARLKKVTAEGDKILSDIGMNELDKDIKSKTFEYFAQQSEADLKIKAEQLNELRNRVLLSAEQVETENIKQEGMKIDNTNKGIETRILMADARSKELEVEFSQAIGIPLGTSEFEVQYALWSQGRWVDMANLAIATNKSAAGGVGQLAAGIGGALKDLRNGLLSLFGVDTSSWDNRSIINPGK